MPENQTENRSSQILDSPIFALLITTRPNDAGLDFNAEVSKAHFNEPHPASAEQIGDSWVIELDTDGLIFLSALLRVSKAKSVPMKLAFFDRKPTFRNSGQSF